MRVSFLFRFLPAVVGILVSSTGCALYERQPLDLAAHTATWRSRDLGVEPIAEYLQRLCDAGADEQASFNAHDGLTLSEAQAVALYFNPDLIKARLAADVPLASARESGWWDDPQFEFEIMRSLNRGKGDRWKVDPPSVEGIDSSGVQFGPPSVSKEKGDRIRRPWSIGVGLGITIPVSGSLLAEEDRAWSEYDVAWRRIAMAEWRTIVELRQAWLAWSIAAERVDVTRKYIDQLKSLTETTRSLADSGEMKPTDARVLAIELETSLAELPGLEADAEGKRQAILAMMGLVPDTVFELIPRVEMPRVEDEGDTSAMPSFATHPRMLLVEAEYEAAERQLALEVRRQYPDITIGPHYGFEEGTSQLGFGVSMPLPLWNHNRRAVAEATAARDTARTEAETTYQSLVGTWKQTRLRLAGAQEGREAMQVNVVPLVDRQIAETRELLLLGEVEVLLLREALRQSLETRLAVLDATQSQASAAVELHGMLQPQWFAASLRMEGEE